MHSNRQYKDSVFSLYMSSEPKRLIEVYNAIQGASYPSNTQIEVNTLDDVLYKERINDVSFTLDGKFVVLIEHQSTINENMPVRMLLYLGRLYEKLLDKKNIYRYKQISLEAPEFLVLYNGKQDFPEQQLLRLSDAFLAKPHENSVELTVKVINTNFGHNELILEKSKSLYDYSFFINKVQEYRDMGNELGEAIRLAVLYCEEHDIMQPFLLKHASEVVNMLLTEWKTEEAIEISREEGREEGHQEGQKEIIQALLETMSIEQIAKALKTTVEDVKKLLDNE